MYMCVLQPACQQLGELQSVLNNAVLFSRCCLRVCVTAACNGIVDDPLCCLQDAWVLLELGEEEDEPHSPTAEQPLEPSAAAQGGAGAAAAAAAQKRPGKKTGAGRPGHSKRPKT